MKHRCKIKFSILCLPLGLIIGCFFWQASFARAQDWSDEYFAEHFIPYKPTLKLKYEVNYRLFWLDLLHIANAVVYATDGEWLNESSGEWADAYLLTFSLDTLEDPPDMGGGRNSIHNRLATVLLKPRLEPLFFIKRDYVHMHTLFSKMDVDNIEIFSVESGRNDYLKKDLIANSVTTNMPQFADLVKQRSEVFRFMKTITGLYAGDTNLLADTNSFTISIYTENAYVPFQVNIQPKLRKISVLDKKFKAIYFKAQPSPGYSGKGRDLVAWVAPFRYVAEMTANPDLIWLAGNTFEMGMIPLMAEYGLRLGTVRCGLTEMRIADE